MASLLIAGFGFLGEALKQSFTRHGWEVVSLSLSGSGDSSSCDLSDRASVAGIPGDYDLIVHCAATRGGGEDAYRAVYFDGCRHLRERFPDTPLIFISSTSVYGQNDHQVVTEESVADPLSATAQVLRQTEDLVIASGGSVLRLSALCGPGRCYTQKAFLAGSARLDGEGERMLNFVHRDDVVAACVLLVDRWDLAAGQVFNASSVSQTQSQCYQDLSQYYDRPMPSRAQPGEVVRRRGNTSKRVNSEKLNNLGWSPVYPDFLSIALNASNVSA